MKQIISLLFFSLTLWSCNTKHKSFFDYDEIDYYYSNISEEEIPSLYDNQSKSKIDKLKFDVILGDTPNFLFDNLSFIKKLPIIGYKKARIDKTKLEKIDEIFSEKPVTENGATACIYVYRDILIFKKQNKIVGVAKICFGCSANEITGTWANTRNFGQDGDYEKLESILKDQRK